MTKALPSLLVGLSQSTVILLVAQLWFRIPFAGSFVTLYFGITLFLLAAAGVRLLVSSVVTTMQQALLASFLLVMAFTLLSGLAYATEQHARRAATVQCDQSAAVYDRHCAACVSGRRRRRQIDVRFAAARRDCRSNPFDRRLCIPPTAGVKAAPAAVSG